MNCAGVIFAGSTSTTYPQDWDYLTDLHVRTPFLLTNFFLENLKQSKGVVINISCDKGTRPDPGLVGYSMCKAGMEMFTKSCALELAPFGIRVNAVSPSYVSSNLYRVAGMSDAELDSLHIRAVKNIPMGRFAEAAEVAKAVIFLTSEQ